MDSARNEYLVGIIPWLKKEASLTIRKYGSMDFNVTSNELVNVSAVHCINAIDRNGITNNFVPLNRTVRSSMRDYMFKEKKYLAEESEEQVSISVNTIDIRDAINSLPDKQRKVILMKYYGNMTSDEIGKLLDTNPAYVRELQGTALQEVT